MVQLFYFLHNFVLVLHNAREYSFMLDQISFYILIELYTKKKKIWSIRLWYFFLKKLNKMVKIKKINESMVDHL
jgi:hypothetical protein